MTREDAIKILKILVYQHDNGNMEEAVRQALAMAINALSVYPQYKWQRDMAIEQLDEYGIPFGAKKDDDVVKVVRCKDCEYKRLCDEDETKYYYCALEDRPNRNWSVDDTDYCSWGERSEE